MEELSCNKIIYNDTFRLKLFTFQYKLFFYHFVNNVKKYQNLRWRTNKNFASKVHVVQYWNCWWYKTEFSIKYQFVIEIFMF